MSKLVIVESPAKAKTIKKYLGKDYEVVASMGHVRDLPQARLSVDINNNFNPRYEIIKGKEKLVEELIELSKNSDAVYLATDPDREGEAISWHLAYILNLNLADANRVEFNEITKYGVDNGMSAPRAINLDLVNAQQARRILDRLVGYKLSPFVSQKIRRGLSAGRVQSVAVRIIVDRENEIRNFNPVEYWSIDAKFSPKGSRKVFSAFLYGNQDGKIELTSKEETDKILADLEGAEYRVSKVKTGTRKKSPAPPFITSTLQQEASRKLGFQSRRTMRVAQELYEGIDVDGIGPTGLITYMRTDSLRISTDAMNEAASYIKSIKTPLTSIINYVALLKRENIENEKAKNYIDVLEQKSQRLKHLTEDLVEASKISSGNIKLECMQIQMQEMIYQAGGEFADKFELKGLTLIENLPSEPLYIRADGRRLWRVLENLYNNVAKYAMENTRVYVDLLDLGTEIKFSIKNISEQRLNIEAKDLTERFIRGDISRSTEGSGLGLSIAKNLTELQGGKFYIYLDGDLFRVTITFPKLEALPEDMSINVLEENIEANLEKSLNPEEVDDSENTEEKII